MVLPVYFRLTDSDYIKHCAADQQNFHHSSKTADLHNTDSMSLLLQQHCMVTVYRQTLFTFLGFIL